ncbi:hypothetical protein PAXRUDRAFT_832554 [Paxillus rubicundulus Ve08.2h10]|uniref:Uncharacterized protein n=1 Tax=Paxillus rubicundulus Ve08.2h10 TaxID=930991 RepID=A0A0D0DCH0_9AGAM|nr:hypothetical protein PAXRUDRAFT_832554 [Paxillus rubicundulus Ve08.2h10]
MDEDIDMDAPQISTLREEDTPPPSRTSKFRVKLLVSDKKGKGKSSSPSGSAVARKNIPPTQPQSRPQSDEEEDEEDEEDQLIDDDEPAPSISAPITLAGTKRKAPSKKARPRKSDKQDKDDKKPDEPQEPLQNKGGQSISAVAPPEKPSPKKKAAPRKAPAASKSKIRAPAKGAKTLTIPLVDDTAMSETHTVTAPSSPFPAEAHSRGGSPEPEEIEAVPAPAPEGSGDSAPLPVYPLPSKPFPVQPPPKIGTGFAPMQPLDRNGARLRQWRVANREIRGIAGGRWFARSWVGDKESEFATAVAAASAAAAAKLADGDKIATPKSVTSISAPILGKVGKSKAARASAGVSTAPSRSGSTVPELHPPKAPTKMRNIIARPASEDCDESEPAVPEATSLSMDS